jgi:uncharacterized protein Yka (UPF0111/DUF47 family)
MTDSTKNLKEEIQAISVYGTGSLPRLLRALSWWADDNNLQGMRVAALANELELFEKNSDSLQDLLGELGVEHASDAIDAVDRLQEKIDDLERKNDDLRDMLFLGSCIGD